MVVDFPRFSANRRMASGPASDLTPTPELAFEPRNGSSIWRPPNREPAAWLAARTEGHSGRRAGDRRADE